MSVKFQLEGIDYSSLKGKSALIVGGGSNAGLASALSLAKAGARVTVADNITHLSVVKAFQSQSLAVQYVKCDVTSWSQLLMAFKQAMQFSPTRSLDIVCSFIQLDRGQDLVDEATQADPRIDVEPTEPAMGELDMNLRAACHLVKLAMHYFGVPDRTTAMKRARSRSGSAASSVTASSIHSRSNSRSGSRPRSGPGSRSHSPERTSPPADAESGEAVVITEEPEQKAEEEGKDVSPTETDKEPEDKPIVFIKSLVIVSAMAAYVDYSHSNFLAAAAFGLRGLFRSLRRKSEQDLSVRVNLVAPWAVRIPEIESRLKELEEEGLIERASAEENAISPTDAIEEDATNAQVHSSSEATTTIPNRVFDDEKAETKTEAETTPAEFEVRENGSSEAETAPKETPDHETGKSDLGDGENKPESSRPTTDATSTDTPSDVKSDEKPKEAAEHGNAAHINGVAEKTNNDTSTSESEPLVNYKSMHFASMDDIVSTVTRLCADSSVSGRSIAVMPEGAFDLNDDHDGSYAGEQVKKLLNMRKEAGDVIYQLLNLVPEQSSS